MKGRCHFHFLKYHFILMWMPRLFLIHFSLFKHYVNPIMAYDSNYYILSFVPCQCCGSCEKCFPLSWGSGQEDNIRRVMSNVMVISLKVDLFFKIFQHSMNRWLRNNSLKIRITYFQLTYVMYRWYLFYNWLNPMFY